jgi:hypothetical protein
MRIYIVKIVDFNGGVVELKEPTFEKAQQTKQAFLNYQGYEDVSIESREVPNEPQNY